MGEVLPLPQGATRVTSSFPTLYNASAGLLSVPPGGNPMQYIIEGGDGPLPGDSAEPAAEALAMPDDLRASLLAAAWKLTAGAATDAEKAQAVVRYFSGYEYSLKPKSGLNGDPIANFVLARRPGFCRDFASGAVMLLRAADVPARLVAGFLVQDWSTVSPKVLIVRARDAHAWVEFYDRVAGHWVRLDPTPLGAMNDALGIAPPSPGSEFMDRVRVRLRLLADTIRQVNLRALLRSIKPAHVLIAAGAIIAGFILILIVRGRKSLRRKIRGISAAREKRRPVRAPAGALTEIHSIFLKEIAKRGVSVRECETGAEILARIKTAPAGSNQGALIGRSEDFIAIYTSARFQKLPPVLMAQAQSSLEQILAELRAAPQSPPAERN